MSFSSDVKTELTDIACAACCETQLSRALLLFGRACSGVSLSLLTEHAGAAAAYAKAVALFSGVTPEISRSESGNYKIQVEDPDVLDAVMGELGETRNEKRQLCIGRIDRDCCVAAFLRGAFLAAGTVTNPDVEYHLEFSCPSTHLAKELIALLEQTGIEAKCTKRGGVNIVYIKKSESIETLLTLMGATENSLLLMGAKMYKDVRNTVNRRVNFENANIARSAAAARRQTEAIETLRRTGKFDELPPELRELAALRLENPESSTAELVEMLGDALTVSGVNHRFGRIIKAAAGDPAAQKKEGGA